MTGNSHRFLIQISVGKRNDFWKKKKISRKFQLMTVILSMSGPQRERNIFPGRNKKSVAINPRLGATTFVIILDVFVASTFESVSDFHRRKFHSKSFNFDSIVATRSIYPQNLFEWKTFLKYFGEHCAKNWGKNASNADRWRRQLERSRVGLFKSIKWNSRSLGACCSR